MLLDWLEAGGAVCGRRSGFAHLSGGYDKLGIFARGSLWNDEFLKASRTFELPAAVAGVCGYVLAANRTRKLKLAH
jgi:hypothetical protein